MSGCYLARAVTSPQTVNDEEEGYDQTTYCALGDVARATIGIINIITQYFYC
jgi:hypothetical protein